jgi:hypothetical protein
MDERRSMNGPVTNPVLNSLDQAIKRIFFVEM